jgi:hypothetical protein
MEPSQEILLLPLNVVSRIDVGRLLREIEALDSFLTQASVREPGTNVKLPKTSRLMDEVIQMNKLNVIVEADRRRLLTMMMVVQKKAPVLHFSFSADPSPLFIKRLMTWLRQEIHPMVLIHIGLQPNIGAGCVVRTTNKYFDFSLREHFKNQRELLIKNLHGVSK